MMVAALVRQRDAVRLVDRVEVAASLVARIIGLLGRQGLPPGQGMLLRPCSSIHTVGMRFSLDVVFFNRRMEVTRVWCALPPWRMATGGRGAHAALEMQAGWFPVGALAPGDRVELQTVSGTVRGRTVSGGGGQFFRNPQRPTALNFLGGN